MRFVHPKTKISKAILIILFSLLIASFFCACSPQKRLNRLVKNHPELLRVEVLTINDTFLTQQTNIDTVFSLLSATKDTFIVTKNNITTKLFIHRDSIFISTISKPDTFVKVIKVPYERVLAEKKEDKFDKLGTFLVLIILLICVGVIRIFLKK
jgi:hypothetical protein